MALIDVVKYDGEPHVYAWKFPDQELSTWTQLIVNQSQEAILFKGGQALDMFGPGRHTLSTANIPILNHLVNLPFGGKSPFTAEVWFVNKISSLDVKWGTAAPIQVKDPKYNIFVPVRAFGQFGLKIEDSRAFLLKLVGTLSEFTRETLSSYLRGMVVMNITEIITSYLTGRQISALELSAYIRELSAHAGSQIGETLQQFGMKLDHFYVENVSVPEDDASVQKLRSVLNEKLEMDLIGVSYTQKRSLDILEDAANNEGGIPSLIMAANLGGAAGAAFGGHMSQITGAMNPLPPQHAACPHCQGAVASGARFCSLCGQAMTAAPQSASGAADKLYPCNKCGAPLAANAKFCMQCGDQYRACPSCGADNAESGVNCRECGASLPKACMSCGEQISGGDKFCRHCGAEQPAAVG